MPFSTYAKDKFMAPYMSTFTAATIRDMSSFDSQQEHWLSNFILNTIFRGGVKPPFRQYMFNFLRRAEAAFRQYELARGATLEFLQSIESVSKYMAAVFHWEVFLSQAWQAYDLLRTLAAGSKVFNKGDGSKEERLNLLYNQSKHTESVVESGNLPTEDATLSIWLNNTGLRSNDSYLTFDEMAEILEDLAKWAKLLQDPASLHEKLAPSSA